MKTPEQVYLEVNRGLLYHHDIKKAMIAYAQEAIKADRENVYKHADVYFDEGTNLENVHVDKNSIINAPNIELL